MNDLPLFPTLEPQRPRSFEHRMIKLRDVQSRLARFFHPDSRPSRNTIIRWIESGTLLGKQLGDGKNYYVYESSLEAFENKLTYEAAMDLAA